MKIIGFGTKVLPPTLSPLKPTYSHGKNQLEQLAEELEQLKRRVKYLESQLLTKQDIIEIEEFLRKNRGELELLSFDEALKELGIDEAEVRKELSKETE